MFTRGLNEHISGGLLKPRGFTRAHLVRVSNNPEDSTLSLLVFHFLKANEAGLPLQVGTYFLLRLWMYTRDARKTSVQNVLSR